MNEPRQLALFDYGTLDHDTRSFLQTKTAEIRILVKQTAQGVIDIGQRLLEVRDRLEHGQFLHWIETEFGWKKSTAYNLINVASNFQPVGNFDFSPKVLYLLAAPSVPEEARQEALCLAESGEKITPAKAQEIIAKHKAEAEAAKQEVKEKQQTITSLQDQIASLESNLTRVRREHAQMLLTKQVDDRDIIRQQNLVEKLEAQIEELKAKAVQPQVIEIEKEVEKIVEVEKLIEVVPEDYDVLKVEVNTLKDKLQTTFKELDKVTKKLSKKEELLSLFGNEQKQARGLQKVSDGMKYIEEAYLLLKDQRLDECVRGIVEGGLQSLNRLFHNLFEGNPDEQD
jgi:hypothetical protein